MEITLNQKIDDFRLLIKLLNIKNIFIQENEDINGLLETYLCGEFCLEWNGNE